MARFPAYAPELRLRINGVDLPAAVRSTLSSVSYEDGWNAADRVTVAFANPDLRWLRQHIRGLGFQPVPISVKVGHAADAAPDGTFDVENRLELAIGYAPDPLETVFSGDVTGVQVGFPSGGMPTMTLVAHDPLQKLAEGTKTRGFGLIPDAVVAAIVAAENRLVPQIDPVILGASAIKAVSNILSPGVGLKQPGLSDFAFLQKIAKEYDADIHVEGDVLHVARFQREQTPRLTLEWGRNLIDFSPKMSTVGQVAAVAARFTLREIPLTFLVRVAWDFDRESVAISVVPGSAAGAPKSSGPTLTIIDRPIRTPQDVASNALKLYRDLRAKLNQRLTGSASAVGDPRIRAGALVRLDGLGPDFSGDYRVKAATHSIGSGGYQTKFEVYKEILP
jgi:phage protein D